MNINLEIVTLEEKEKLKKLLLDICCKCVYD